jgi:hypothetical protein
MHYIYMRIYIDAKSLKSPITYFPFKVGAAVASSIDILICFRKLSANDMCKHCTWYSVERSLEMERGKCYKLAIICYKYSISTQARRCESTPEPKIGLAPSQIAKTPEKQCV